MTAGGLLNKGKHAAWLDDYGSYLMHKETGVTVPLVLEENQCWLDALVAPITDESGKVAVKSALKQPITPDK